MMKMNCVLITGASSGIGRTTAITLSKEYNLILSGRNEEALAQTLELCDKGSKIKIFNRDIGELDNLEADLANFIKENELEITHFVHCAGFMKMLPLKVVSTESLEKTFSINVFSAMILIKTLNSKRHNNSALKNVVLVSSNISNFGAKSFSVYSASKAALDGMMRSLAIELGPTVRINSVLPGAVETEMTKDIFANEELITRMRQTYPLGLGDAQNITDAIAFLMSNKSAWMTGQQITVDGGRTINISG